MNTQIAFGTVLAGLNVSPEVRARITDQLAQAAGRTPTDPDFFTQVDAPTAAQLHKMLDLRMQLDLIGLNYTQGLLAAGEPLTAEQNLSLAELFRKTFDEDPEQFQLNAADVRLQGYDPKDGLTDLDRSLLKSATTFLTPAQVTAIKSDLKIVTARWKRLQDTKKSPVRIVPK